jgi:hypothetical protein
VEIELLTPKVLRGKQVFYNAADPRLSLDRFLSCAVCHLDGNRDRRVWDFSQRGEGLRRTTTLLGKSGMGHGPLHWSANFNEMQDFENDIRGGFGGKGFLSDAVFNAGTRSDPLGDAKAGLSPELDDLAAYVASLDRARPSPYRNPGGSLTTDGEAGRLIFNRVDVGCARCHAPPNYTDSKLPGGVPPVPSPGDTVTAEGFLLHDVGTFKPGSGSRRGQPLPGLDAPTLKGVWEGGPYLHDGSAATLMDVITAANPGDKHGKTSHLTAQEKNQLVAFLLQVDDSASGPGSIGDGRGRLPWKNPIRLLRTPLGWELPGLPPENWRSIRLRFTDIRGHSLLVLRPSRVAAGLFFAHRDRVGALPSGLLIPVLESGSGPPRALKIEAWTGNN